MKSDNSSTPDDLSQFEFEEYLVSNLDDKTQLKLTTEMQDPSSRLGIRLFLKRLVEVHFINRLYNLLLVSKFILLWTILMVAIGAGLVLQIRDLSYYEDEQVISGGTYTEGMVGQATNFNPIYASTQVDQAVAKLVFAPLFKYDEDNQLQGVLAQSISSDEKAQQFTLVLKPNLQWHDSKPLTIDDVIFTIETIKNAQAQSPLRSNWQGVEIDKIDDSSLVFTLPASFSAFADNLTLSIIPQHLLKDYEPAELRGLDFNYQPIGSGMFEFSSLIPLTTGGIDQRELRIELSRNPNWQVAHNQEILLDNLHLWVVPNQQRLTELFNQNLISGSLDLDADQINLSETNYEIVDLKLMSGVYLLFNHSSSFLKDNQARQAVASGLDVSELLASLDYTPQRILGPLLSEHLGYQAPADVASYSLSEASRLLKSLGYVYENNYWTKDGQILSLRLTVQAQTDYEVLAKNIQKQLETLGIKVVLDLKSADNLPTEVLQNHQYGDMLIYGFNLGHDSDVYSFWHSSQVETQSIFRFNLAQYKSLEADQALEIGRSRYDLELRAKAYEDFQVVWQKDLPALALYRPQLKYYTTKGVRGPSSKLLLVNPSDRFDDVHRWAVILRGL